MPPRSATRHFLLIDFRSRLQSEALGLLRSSFEICEANKSLISVVPGAEMNSLHTNFQLGPPTLPKFTKFYQLNALYPIWQKVYDTKPCHLSPREMEDSWETSFDTFH
jgi:hypothetical protein